MISLEEGMLLYHGSYKEISTIDLSVCRAGLDFGRGFYVTSSYEQALNYIPASIKKNIRSKKIPPEYPVSEGRISVFRFHPDPSLLIHCFPTADIDWLHFIAASRDDSLFPDVKKFYLGYDVIGGKVADDNTSATLNAYISGDLGVPGTASFDDFVIGRLLPDRLTDQFCFRTERSIQTLEFIRSDRYGDKH